MKISGLDVSCASLLPAFDNDLADFSCPAFLLLARLVDKPLRLVELERNKFALLGDDPQAILGEKRKLALQGEKNIQFLGRQVAEIHSVFNLPMGQRSAERFLGAS